MVKIQEIKPIKLSGLSSFLVSFSYSDILVNICKSIGTGIYHKKLTAWEFPAYSLSKLLDEFCLADTISLTLLPENEAISDQPPLTETEISRFKIRPFDHQIDGINFLLRQRKSLLLDSMGIGKTLEMICYAETLKNRGLIDHCLIICGVNSVKLNWEKEIHKFSNQGVLVLGKKINRNGKVHYASISDRSEQLKAKIDEFFVVTNIETLRSEKIIEAFKKSENHFGLICVDEVHKCANTSSDQGHNLRKLDSEYKVAATGTLITNNPISCYGPLSWTENDNATLTNYKGQYCEFGGFGGTQVIGYKNLNALQEELDSCSIRRTFDMINSEMPEKTIELELVEMEDEHKKFYEAIKDGIKEEADKIELKTGNLLALTTRLRQATAAPSVLTTQDIMSTKIERCAELAEELAEQGQKVVILSNFIEPVYKLGKLLEKYRPLLNTGDTADDLVSENVDKFQNDPNCLIFIGTHSKCGTGLSLPAAHYMLMIDTPWTYAQFAQSCDRIYRITSKQNVYIKVLACADTIDERVWDIVETKRELSDYLVDGKSNERFDEELRKIIMEL